MWNCYLEKTFLNSRILQKFRHTLSHPVIQYIQLTDENMNTISKMKMNCRHKETDKQLRQRQADTDELKITRSSAAGMQDRSQRGSQDQELSQ